MHEKKNPSLTFFKILTFPSCFACSRVGFNSKEDMDSDSSLVGGTVCGIKDEVVIKQVFYMDGKNGSIANFPACSLSRKRRSSMCSTALILGRLGGIF